MSPKALERQAYGRFQVDIRVCNGRKGFPHIATDGLDLNERAQVRARLLGTIQAAVKEGVLTEDDLVLLAGVVPSVEPHQQLPLLASRVQPALTTRPVSASLSTTRVYPVKE